MNFSLAMNAIWREKSTARNKAGPHTERCMIATSHTVLVGNTEMRTYIAVEKKKCVDSVTNKKYDVLFKR